MTTDESARVSGIAPPALDLCIQFANTLSWRGRPHPDEHLTSYDRLTDWSLKAGILGEAVAARLRAEARRRPAEAEAVLAGAIRLREAIYRLFCAVRRGEAPSAT